MNYFEKCKKRVENAKSIEQEINGRAITYFTMEYLDITKVYLADIDIIYRVSYKHVLVPLSENEKKHLFELCEKHYKEREDARDKQILEEL